jgi:hypothetical protein
MNPITTAVFNIDQAHRVRCKTGTNEPDPNKEWDNRAESLAQMINECGADIICVLEMRNLQNSKIPVRKFLSMLNYDYEYVYYCEYNLSFAMAILYKSDKFYVLDSDRFHLHNNPGNDKIMFGLKFKVKGSNNGFWVYGTHFAIDEPSKWEGVNKIIERFGNAEYPVIIAGDFNFFDDLEGIPQRNKMLTAFEDLAFPLKDLDGDFYGYSGDVGKRKVVQEGNRIKGMSRLIHIFSKNIQKLEMATAYKWTPEMILNETYPTDHLAIMMKVGIPYYQVDWI